MKLFQKIGRVCSLLLTILLALILLCNLYTIAVRAITGQRQPTIFGYASAVVISGSMSGAVEVNDMVVTRRQDSYAEGDIITFDTGHSLVTHRIVGLTQDGFITRGDANNTEDTDPVPQEAVVGKVILVVPGIGQLIEYLRTPLGMTCLALVGFLLLELPAISARRTSTGGNHDEEQT